jgi:hypothetical protein
MKLSMKAENGQRPVVKKFNTNRLVTVSIYNRSLTSFVPISDETEYHVFQFFEKRQKYL